MIKIVCDCCGSETFKQNEFITTRIDMLGREVTLCPECSETIKIECAAAEDTIMAAVRTASRSTISDIIRRFEAFNAVELLSKDDVVALNDSIIDEVLNRVFRKKVQEGRGRPVAVSSSYSPITLGRGITNVQSNTYGSPIGIDENFIKEIIDDKWAEFLRNNVTNGYTSGDSGDKAAE